MLQEKIPGAICKGDQSSQRIANPSGNELPSAARYIKPGATKVLLRPWMETAGLTVNEVQCGLHCLWLIKVKLWLQRSTVKEVQSRSDVLGRTLPGHSLDQMWWFGASVVSK